MSKSKAAKAAAADKTPPAPAAASAPAPETQSQPPENDDRALIGSSVQPSTFALSDGTEIQLGDVVRKAFEASGLSSAREWNEQDPQLVEAFIQEQVDKLELAADEVAEDEGEADPDTAGGTFAGPAPVQPPEAPAPDQSAPAAKAWFWIRDINFGQHKPGDRFEGTEEEALALAAKELVALK